MHNQSFTKGDTTGYKIKGRSKIVESFFFQKENFPFQEKKPSSGQFMVILDDPNLIDKDDGVRVDSSSVNKSYAEKDPESFLSEENKIIIPFVHGNNDFVSRSLDGASLETKRTMKENSILTIRSQFLTGEKFTDRDDFNDFAVAYVIDEAGEIVFKDLLHQSLDLPSDRWTTGWQSKIWRSPKNFKATIRIAVCNGIRFKKSSGPDAFLVNGGRANPSGLLVDCICVSGG